MKREETENLELLELDEEIEEINKRNGLYMFPTATLFPVYDRKRGQERWLFYFNRPAISKFGIDRFKFMKWGITSNYVVGTPTDDNIGNYAIMKNVTHKNYYIIICNCPIILVKNKGLNTGNYRLYKYKDGFAFKRYETLEQEASV